MSITVDDLLRAKVKLKCYQVLRWALLDLSFLLRRELCLKLSND